MDPAGKKAEFIFGPFSHQIVNRWDQCAEIPILGNLTSLARTVTNIGQLMLCVNKQYSKKHFKASLTGLKKGAVGSIPIIGTLLAIYVINKDNNKKIVETVIAKAKGMSTEYLSNIASQIPESQKKYWLKAVKAAHKGSALELDNFQQVFKRGSIQNIDYEASGGLNQANLNQDYFNKTSRKDDES
jgi:hypothetical protein